MINEETIIQDIMEDNSRLMEEKGGYLLRAQHAKGHGCVKAIFTVREDIEDTALKVGLFSTSKQYEAVIRFSNARRINDTEKDAHGMAIKLLNVPGLKLHPGHEKGNTFDFVLIDHPIMFAANLKEYHAISKLVDNVTSLELENKNTISDKIKTKIGKISALLTAIKHGSFATVKRLKKFPKDMPSSPIVRSYWSQTPYKLGEALAVKYVARSCSTDEAIVSNTEGLGKDALKDALEQVLAMGEAKFTFGVHKRRENDSIDDSTKPWWSETDVGGLKSMIPLADITITGFVEESDLMAENLVFSAWNVTDAHEPLGGINRVRRKIYADLATKRHNQNGAQAKCPFAEKDYGSTDWPE